MARKKIRHYPSREHYEEMVNNYFVEHKGEVINDLLEKLGYRDLQSLAYDEYNMRFGFDCGWVNLIPKNEEMFHEWELDNGRYCAKVWCRPSYDPQSTTIKRIQVEKAVKDLGIEDMFYVETRLD